MSQELPSFAQLYHNILLRLTTRAESGVTLTEEEALLCAEASRYLTAVCKSLRMSQEDYNKQQEKDNKDDDDSEDERSVKPR